MRILLTMGAAAALCGCASLSGYDATDKFACKAPEGILCESMTGIYENAQQQNLPGQKVNLKGKAAAASSDTNTTAASSVLTKPISSGTPIRSAPRVLRVWFAPWEDTDGDLHDQSYVYLPVNAGRWLIEHNRRRIQDTYRPVKTPFPQTTIPSTAGPAPARGEATSNMRLGADVLVREQQHIEAQRKTLFGGSEDEEESVGVVQPRPQDVSSVLKDIRVPTDLPSVKE